MKIKKILFSGSLILCLVSVLVISVYKILERVDNQQCWETWANKYKVDPNYVDIGTAILAEILDKNKAGDNRTQIYSSFKDISPIFITPLGQTIEGENLEIINLKLCKFFDNNFDYLLTYKTNDQFTDLRLDIGD